jgi:hypothetical protein
VSRLVDIDAVRPSAYNPRQADPARLDLVELSLRKLGWLLPIYADMDGEIVSGHQRHHVAQRMGATRAPVEYLPAMDLAERKAVNIAFNRGTNDFDRADVPKTITEALARAHVDEAAARLDDKALDSPESFPCLNAVVSPIRPILEANRGRWITYAKALATLLHGKGVSMPIVVTPDLRVINGIGRLELAAELGEPLVNLVMVTPEEADLAFAMLNLLSMDFDLHTRYADLLRYNSFRRTRAARDDLGVGYVFALVRSRAAKTLDVRRPADRKRWIEHYGSSVVDFGAGLLHETRILRSVGISVSPFEPYHVVNDEIDKFRSLRICRAFLEDVASGKRWTSVFLNSVLNSVPFDADRQHIATLCQALCWPDATLHASAASVRRPAYRLANGRENTNDTSANTVIFRLSYEEGITLGDFSATPKVQKHFTDEEFADLWRGRFSRVAPEAASHLAYATCSSPARVSPDALRAAIAFEFDLPYPDGSRLGLVPDALAAFSARLGMAL